jgi:hypothetical protein
MQQWWLLRFRDLHGRGRQLRRPRRRHLRRWSVRRVRWTWPALLRSESKQRGLHGARNEVQRWHLRQVWRSRNRLLRQHERWHRHVQ